MRTASTFHLVLPPQPAGTTAYEWLYSAIRKQILSGQLRPGARIPATRDIASQLGLSRGTIMNAFDQLKAEGYLSGSVGAGTFVSALLPDELQTVAAPLKKPAMQESGGSRPLSTYAQGLKLFPGFSDAPTRAFRSNLPALDLFPIEKWAKISARRMRSLSPRALMGPDALGYRPLRDALADYLVRSRGVQCTAEQVAVVGGVQEAFHLIARLTVDQGEKVCIEDPGYPGAAFLVEAMGASVAWLTVDDEGIALQQEALRAARLVYLTPAHQFPTGITMSLTRRMEWIAWAHRTGAILFEDDYDSEFRYSSRPLPAMQGLDRHGCVVFAGTFSKVLFPSLRLGYMVLPPDLVEVAAAAISLSTRHAPMIDQLVLCDFITEGHFGRHLRRMREVYAGRLAALQDAARQELKGRLELSQIEAGLQTVGWLNPGVDGASVARLLAERKVQTTPVSRYARRPLLRDGLQLGFAAINESEIRRGVAEMANVLDFVG